MGCVVLSTRGGSLEVSSRLLSSMATATALGLVIMRPLRVEVTDAVSVCTYGKSPERTSRPSSQHVDVLWSFLIPDGILAVLASTNKCLQRIRVEDELV